jgi:hypothetical protein
MGFRVGRKFAQHFYPEPSHPVEAAPTYARNFGSGPATDVAVATTPGTQIVWSNIQSGIGPGVAVPVTPETTGILRISGTISLAGSGQSVQLLVGVNGFPLSVPAFERATVSGFESISFLTETSAQPIGSPANISIQLIGSATGISVIGLSSTIDIQELPAATGWKRISMAKTIHQETICCGFKKCPTVKVFDDGSMEISDNDAEIGSVGTIKLRPEVVERLVEIRAQLKR